MTSPAGFSLKQEKNNFNANFKSPPKPNGKLKGNDRENMNLISIKH